MKKELIELRINGRLHELAARTAKPLTTSALTQEYRREMVRVFAKRAVLAAANSGL
jgi:CO/xanthine dehydrogenase FAD-binding subunit